MISKAVIDKLRNLSDSLEIRLNEKVIITNSGSLLMGDEKVLLDRIEFLMKVINETKDDFEAKREAISFVRKLEEKQNLAILLDDPSFIQELSEESEFERLSLQAALLGAEKIAQELFERKAETKPDVNIYFISYAICSGRIEWVQSLIKTFNLKITDPKFCFEVYAHRMGNQRLIEYYHEQANTSRTDKAGFFSGSKVIDLKNSSAVNIIKIPEPLMDCLHGAFDCVLELIDACDETIKPYIFSILQDSDIEPKQAISIIKYLQEDGSINFDLSASFGLLFCALHPIKWLKYPYRQHYEVIFQTTPLIYLPEENRSKLNEITILLKTDLLKYLKVKIREIPLQFKKSPDNYDIFKTDALNSQSETEVIIENKLVADYLKTDQDEAKENTSPPGESSIVKSNIIVSCDSKQLTLSHPVWPKIYDMVKYTPKSHCTRDEKLMLNIIKSILYKKEHDCKWQDLPKWSEPVGKIYYYYRKWKAENLLEKLLTTINSETAKARPM